MIGLYLDYVDDMYRWDRLSLVNFVAHVSSCGSFAIILCAAWMAYLSGEIAFFTLLFSPVIVPLPVHLLHIALFGVWVYNRKPK